MAEEIQEAVQIIRVAYDGIEIAMKVGSGGIAAMQKAIDFLKGMLDYEKSLGKTSMRKLMLKGGDLQVLQFNTEDMKTQRIVEILKSGAVDSDIVVKGWVRTKRGNKNVAFIALNDGSCVANIQVVVDLAKIPDEQLKPITTGACIRVD